MRFVFGALALSGIAVAASGCSALALDPPPPPPYTVAVVVEGDPGKPVAGATVKRSAMVLGTTGIDGRAELTLRGVDGDVVNAEVSCPEGFTSPTKPVSMRLARLADGSRAPEFRVACPPTMRHLVLAIKADNGASLPVMYLGKVVARTDASGAAHFAIDLPPGTGFSVALDTSGNGKLKPQNPVKPFTVGRADDLFLWEQKFEVEKKRIVVVKPHKPTCINCAPLS